MKQSWKGKLAELVEEEELEDEKPKSMKKFKIINECEDDDQLTTVFASKDGETYKRITFHPTTVKEQLSKIQGAEPKGYSFYKLVPDVKAEKAVQAKKSELKEKTVSKNEKTSKGKTSKTETKATRKHVKRERVDDGKILAFCTKSLKHKNDFLGRNDKFNPQLVMNAMRDSGIACGWDRFLGILAKAQKGGKKAA